MRERAVPRPMFILARGAYDADRAVEPGTAALGPVPKAAGQPAGAGALAHVARHPWRRGWSSIARAQLFGAGLATPADFGSQGRLPTHPALLDGWRRTSSRRWTSRRRSSRAVGDVPAVVDHRRRGEERDPANEWLSRGLRIACRPNRCGRRRRQRPARREDRRAERHPYQPAGLWEALATRNATSYQVGKGDDCIGGASTPWKRSSPPSAIGFDAAERLFGTVTRQWTSTPLQALVLLNDPQFVEAAALAARMIHDAGGDVGGRSRSASAR